jgi:hypothetical protein
MQARARARTHANTQDASKTGRFCLGINTAFHLGDCILLVTGHRLVAFDPMRKFFPEPLLVEFGGPGAAGSAFADTYPDFCRAFLAYGITFREEYRGTLFRIPLRTKAEAGGLTKRVYSVQDIWTDLLEDFVEHAAQCLLFLKKMQRITVHSLTAAGRREVCKAEVDAHRSEQFLLHRTALLDLILAKPLAGVVFMSARAHSIGWVAGCWGVCAVSDTWWGGKTHAVEMKGACV